MGRQTGMVVVAALALAAVLPPSTARADSYDLVTVGARAEGMGGTGIAAAEDSSALFHNPAALVTIGRPEVALCERWLSDRQDGYTGTHWSDGPTHRHSALNLAAFAYPVKTGEHALVLGVAYHRPIDLVTHYRGASVRGGLIAYSPGAAVALAPWLAAGIAVNIWDGDRQQEHTADGTTMWWKASYSGANATAGLYADLRILENQSPWRFGLALRTPFDLKIHYHDRTASAGQPQVTSAYDYEVEMPWTIGLGAACELGDRATLTAEIENRRFSGRKIVANGAAGKVMSPLSSSNDDLNPVRLGLEYRFQISGWIVPVRAGYRTVPTLRADLWDGWPTNQVRGDAITIGTGVGRRAFRADLAVSRSRYEVADRSGALITHTRRTYQNVMLELAYRF